MDHCQCTNVPCVSGSTVVCHTAMYVLFHENKQIEMEIEIIFWPSVLRSRGSLNWLSNTKWYDRQSVQSAHYYYYIIIKRKNRAMYILALRAYVALDGMETRLCVGYARIICGHLLLLLLLLLAWNVLSYSGGDDNSHNDNDYYYYNCWRLLRRSCPWRKD